MASPSLITPTGNVSIAEGPSPVFESKFLITSAQILALTGASVNPILLIPSGGPGTIQVVLEWEINFVYGGIAYTGTASFNLDYGPPPGLPLTAINTWIANNVLTSVANKISRSTAQEGFANQASSVPINQALYLSNDGGSGLAAGNSPLIITIRWRTLTGVN
jgi:hypothetical protein